MLRTPWRSSPNITTAANRGHASRIRYPFLPSVIRWEYGAYNRQCRVAHVSRRRFYHIFPTIYCICVASPLQNERKYKFQLTTIV